jgi:hypothetical protein
MEVNIKTIKTDSGEKFELVVTVEDREYTLDIMNIDGEFMFYDWVWGARSKSLDEILEMIEE